jgi:ribonuclease VapC
VIVDTSAIVAIFLREPDYEPIVAKLQAAPSRAIGTPTLSEAGIVLVKSIGPSAAGTLSRFLDEAKITVVPFGDEHWKEAVYAYERFGKGRKHPASLNFGDCMTYAVAKLADEPLLCTGRDFAKTDLALA